MCMMLGVMKPLCVLLSVLTVVEMPAQSPPKARAPIQIEGEPTIVVKSEGSERGIDSNNPMDFADPEARRVMFKIQAEFNRLAPDRVTTPKEAYSLCKSLREHCGKLKTQLIALERETMVKKARTNEESVKLLDRYMDLAWQLEAARKASRYACTKSWLDLGTSPNERYSVKVLNELQGKRDAKKFEFLKRDPNPIEKGDMKPATECVDALTECLDQAMRIAQLPRR